MIIVTGAAGQLGTDVVRELEKRNIPHIGIDIADVDITDEVEIKNYFIEINGKYDIQSVIHCAAYTAVDKAEDEPELCYKVNVVGTENIVKLCQEIGAEMIYISTDYVFDGKGDVPYEIDSPKIPISVYGKSKLAGEKVVIESLEKYYIVRISWVFGITGNNFVKTMLKLSETRDEINVVADQIGSPTYTVDLAKLLCDMIFSEKYGEYHATNEGFCSWAEFATEIMQINNANVADNSKNYDVKICKINPISTEEYPTKAVRPKNSRLSKSSLDENGFTRLPTWQDALERFINQLDNM
ncbi:MAG: dTDP-4-dehydrorhamnose reductase [Oscillospiraceae bacterium]|jgi:dTDP-4-dehydrorhamnose reductase|nr:dTDP-4-dehydrorhamnose reductase [Oscillospiraceae bacterium]